MTLLIACFLIFKYDLSPWWYVASAVVFIGELVLKDYLVGLLALERARQLESALVEHMKRNYVGPSCKDLEARIEVLEEKLKK